MDERTVRWARGRRVAGVVALVAVLGAAVACGGGSDDAADGGPGTSADGGPSVVLEPVGSVGDDPFAESVAITETAEFPDAVAATADATLTALAEAPDGGRTATGDTPGLYGGTRDDAVCDVGALGDFLTDPANVDKATAFAEVLGGTVEGLADQLATLTPVVLTADTLVTNHGFRDGTADPFPAVLQAGTAVLVDANGTPRVKCSCGNPLGPPPTGADLGATTGDAWTGYAPDRTVSVTPSAQAIDSLTLVDTTTGDTFQGPTGSAAGEPIDPQTVLLPADSCSSSREYPTPHPPVQLTGGEGTYEEDGFPVRVSVDSNVVTGDVDGDGAEETMFSLTCYDTRAPNPSGAPRTIVTLRPGPEGAEAAAPPVAAHVVNDLSLDGDILTNTGLTFGPTDNNADGPTQQVISRWQWQDGGWTCTSGLSEFGECG